MIHKRIKELVERAGGSPNYSAFRGHFLPPPPDYIDPVTVDLEKFAELIVRECASLCAEEEKTYRKHRKNSFDFEEKNIFAEGEAACSTLQHRIKQHFGIK